MLFQCKKVLYCIVFPKNCLFGTFKLVKKAINSQFTYNGQGKAFD